MYRNLRVFDHFWDVGKFFLKFLINMNIELKVTSKSYFNANYQLKLRFKFQFLVFKKKLMMYLLLKFPKKKEKFFL
jgi:hypothetical protein